MVSLTVSGCNFSELGPGSRWPFDDAGEDPCTLGGYPRNSSPACGSACECLRAIGDPAPECDPPTWFSELVTIRRGHCHIVVRVRVRLTLCSQIGHCLSPSIDWPPLPSPIPPITVPEEEPRSPHPQLPDLGPTIPTTLPPRPIIDPDRIGLGVPLMRAFVRLLLLSLFAGMAITVLVAWGLAFIRVQWIDLKPTTASWMNPGDGPNFGIHRFEVPGALHVRAVPSLSKKPKRASDQPSTPSEQVLPKFIERRLHPGSLMFFGARGWPMWALWYEAKEMPDGRGRSSGYLDVKMPAFLSKNRQVVFPFRLLWPGFAVDSAFYAALCFVTLLSGRQMRRKRRRLRGHCAKCKYDLQGNFASGCPECGWQRANVKQTR